MAAEHSDRALKSYILRLWREDSAETSQWRVSLTPIPQGNRIGFACIADAMHYLETHSQPASKEA